MYYEYIVNSKRNFNIYDISFCELELFINENKSYILEIVYEYLNEYNELTHDKSCYLKFLSFISELKKTKEKKEYSFNFMDLSNEEIIWDISCDISYIKTCNLQSHISNEKIIKKIFKLKSNEK